MSAHESLFDHVPVEKGMVLLHQYKPLWADGDYRYELWAVTSVRRSAKSASLKLIQHRDGAIIEATATFPDGLVTDPWQVFSLSTNDLAHVWKAHEREAVNA